MRIYLDNNILVDIENEDYSLNDFCSVPNVDYFYSEVHMDELMNGLDSHPELKDTRLHTIEQLCGSNYILPGVLSEEMELFSMSPQRAFELSMRYKFLHDHIYQYTRSMNINRDIFLKSLKLEKREIVNISPAKILNVLDERMQEHWGYGIEVYLEKQEADQNRTRYNTLFNLLDFVYYWRDESHTARLYDASHAYFAQICDLLVSNDKRMRIKSEAVYSYLGVKTKVMTADEYLKKE